MEHTVENTAILLARANELYARNSTSSDSSDQKERPPVYKAIGISLAIASGLFIGTSFVLKKTGLLKANVKYNEEAGEGYGYLKNAYWWSGMTLMIIGEICNFVAYAFVDAILVTPLGALSVVITTILSAIFLKERLSFVGKVGCFMCIIGSVVIVMNAPAQSSASKIQDMERLFRAPVFLSYACVIIAGCTFIALWVGPRYGKKSMLVYLSICSLIGGLSVVATQGLGAAIVTQAGGTPQFNQWFLYFLLVFVVCTLVTEIIFLNKALNLFNAALVTPTYYVFFTSSTIVTSAILFQGFKGSVTSIITVVLGFLQICAGVVLLQLSKSAKDVPDAAVFTGDLDQVRTVAEQEEPESEPKADAIRGAAAILRRVSQTRQKTEVQEAKRVHEMRMKDQLEPVGENEQIEWDGLRRRKTIIDPSASPLQRRKTQHPPLGMSSFPADYDPEDRPSTSDIYGSSGIHRGFFNSFRRQASHKFSTSRQPKSLSTGTPTLAVPSSPGEDGSTPPTAQVLGAMEMDHVYGLPPSLRGGEDKSHLDSNTAYTGASSRDGQAISWASDVDNRPSSARSTSNNNLAPPAPPPHGGNAKRQFSFTNPFHRRKASDPPSSSMDGSNDGRPSSRLGIGSRGSNSRDHAGIPSILKTATEEERLGLVKGDSRNQVDLPEYESEDDWELEGKGGGGDGGGGGLSDNGGGRREGGNAVGGANNNIPWIREESLSSEEDLGRVRKLDLEDEDGHSPGYGGGSRGGGAPPAFI